MKIRLRFFWTIVLSALVLTASGAVMASENSKNLTSPENHFGFLPGTDCRLFDYEELLAYLGLLDRESPRLSLFDIGRSPMGKPMMLAVVSSEENILRLDELKTINRELALNPSLTETQRQTCFERGKVFVVATLSMHSGEVGPTQSSPLVIHSLVSGDDPETRSILDRVVFLMVPCHNPDGMDMVVEHYRKTLGTRFEGTDMPGIYHKYVGHDNNRDFLNLTQEDTRSINRIFSAEWFPQVMVEKHQMGGTGPRYFVPPPHDPIAENVDAGIWNWVSVFGSGLLADMTEKGQAGVCRQYIFDDYWVGSTETCIWKNVIGFLTECSSADVATPVFVEPIELEAEGKGLSEYKKSINMPLPWPGGWWKLSDIVDYECESMRSILKTAALHDKDILQFRNDLCRKETEAGRTVGPYYYVFPQKQQDPGELVDLVGLLQEHGIACHRLSGPVSVDGRNFEEGDIVVALAQPFRPMIKEILEIQRFPVRRYTPQGPIIRPYDITSWSLPLHRGIDSREIRTRSRELEALLKPLDSDFTFVKSLPERFWAVLLPAAWNRSFQAAFLASQLGLHVERLEEPDSSLGSRAEAGSFLVTSDDKKTGAIRTVIDELRATPIFLSQARPFRSTPLSIPRVALVETYFHDIDAGWTRLLFDRYHIPYRVVRPGDVEKTDWSRDVDVVVLPDADPSVLVQGKWKAEDKLIPSGYPPPYNRGMGPEGKKKLVEFVNAGGIAILWGRSGRMFLEPLEISLSKTEKEEFLLPVRDVSESLEKEGLYCPGSLVRVRLLGGHPLTRGMGETVDAFFRGRPVFSTWPPERDMDRRVVGWFGEKPILTSGYIENEEKLVNKAALVWTRKGKGQMVFFAFNPPYRASTQGTYKLLFNALLLPRIQ